MAPRSLLACLALLATSACALMPRELNLTPFWFHRLDAQGHMLEWDAAWPILHYERTADGGDDFRIRPLWRRVTEPSEDAVEHQFLWPFGRVRIHPDETSARLFPLWSWRSRENIDGTRDVDWYLIFPLIWGGSSGDDTENYFAFLPFFGEIPEFITYDRFRTVLFPLWVGLDKGGHRHNIFLWPFVGVSSCAENGHSWFRIWPFYGHDIEPGQHDRRFVLWPFIAWSTENENTDSGTVHSFWLWPLFGTRSGGTVSGWTVLWPFFSRTVKADHFTSVVLLWPFYHYYWNRAMDNLQQWWLWPFVGVGLSDRQHTWSFAWPLIWWREYDDPDGHTEQQWVLPFWWHIRLTDKAGETENHTKLWPLAHRTQRRDADGNLVGGEWSLLSPWPWRDLNARGFEEAWGWLFEIGRGVQRARDDTAVDLGGRLFTTREREGEASASVPFLFNYERDRAGNKTFRLFQFLPIPLGGGEEPRAGERPR
jgi:hypothetical protein